MLPLSRFRLFFKVFLSFCCCFIFFNCSISSPEILEVASFVIWEPVFVEELKDTDSTIKPDEITGSRLLPSEDPTYQSRLACFVRFNDENGVNDFSFIRISQAGKYGFSWEIDRESSVFSRFENKYYAGASYLCFPKNMQVQSGEYLVSLYDLYGNLAEKEFSVGTLAFKPENARSVLAEFEIQQNMWKIVYSKENQEKLRKGLFLFDGSDKYLGTYELSVENGTVSSIKNRYPAVKKARFYQYVLSDKEMVISKSFKIG